MSAITTIAQGQIAQRFLGLEPQLRQLKKALTEGATVPVGPRNANGSQAGVPLTATQVNEALGSDAAKQVAAIDAALAVYDSAVVSA